jgi:hypothetical protein
MRHIAMECVLEQPKNCLGLGPFRRLPPTCHTGGLLRRGFSMAGRADHSGEANAVFGSPAIRPRQEDNRLPRARSRSAEGMAMPSIGQASAARKPQARVRRFRLGVLEGIRSTRPSAAQSNNDVEGGCILYWEPEVEPHPLRADPM